MAVLSTRWTIPCDVSGFFKKSFTTAVSVCSCTFLIHKLLTFNYMVEMNEVTHTEYDSSVNVSTNIPSSSSALSIVLAYSPMIQINDAFASGSSSSSRLEHNMGITPS